MDETPNLGLPYILAAQSQKHVTHNEAIRALDAIVQLSVLDRDLAAPPGSPANGARYIVAASPSGAWSGHAGDVAAYQDGAWAFYDPVEGFIAWVSDEDAAVVWNGSAWTALTTGSGGAGSFSTVGINATADATNKLAVAAAATLLNHNGAGHQLKINKASSSDTASLLYQDAFSGCAELGLAGDDDFHFKVSADGTTWKEAIVINRTTGAASFPLTPGRQILTANRTYYVRTDGSDSNTGLANTSGGAWLTWQHAYDYICANLDVAGYTITVQVGDGTYTNALAVNKTWLGGGAVFFSGNSGTPSNVLMSLSGADCILVSVPLSGTLQLKHFKMSTSGAGMACIRVSSPGVLIVHDNLDFGAVNGSSGVHIVVSAPGSSIQGVTSGTGYKISGAFGIHWQALFGGNIQVRGVTITITGTPAIGFAFAECESCATLNVDFLTFSGSATGTRYSAFTNSVIYTGGGGASYLPGNSAGSTATGAQYV